MDLPYLGLSPLEILRRGNKDIVIDGPYPELAEECMKKFERFDPSGIRVSRQKRPSSHETIGPSFGRDTPALRAFPDLGETGPPSRRDGTTLGESML